MHGLAFDNISGVLYGVSDTDSGLYRISTTTGEARHGFIGTFFPNPGDTINGLAFNPADNLLYGSINGPSRVGGLVRIDTSTGHGTFWSSTQPLADIAFNPQTGVLYGVDNGGGRDPDALYTIDLATGQTSLLGLTGLHNNLGLEFVPVTRA